MAQFIIGIIVVVFGVILTTVGGYVTKDGWEKIHHKDKNKKSSDIQQTVIGNDANVTVIQNRGADAELLDKVMKAAEAKGRAELQAEQLKEQLAKAVERIKKIEAEGNRPDAEKALEAALKSGDLSGLQELLIKDRDEHQQALIQRNREIAAVAYLRGDIDIAIEAINEILKELPDDLPALNQRGNIHRLQGKLNEAQSDFNQILELATETINNQARAIAFGNLGIIYHIRSEFDKAEEMHLKSLEIYRRLGLHEGMARSYGNLGNVYFERGEPQKAEEMIKNSLEIAEKFGLLQIVARAYGNLWYVYCDLGEFDKAEEMQKKSLEIAERHGMLEVMASQYRNTGLMYWMRGELDKAEVMQKKSLEIDKKLDRLEGMAKSYANLGLIYKSRSDNDKARQYCEKALVLYRRIGIPHMVEKTQSLIDEIEN